MKSKQMIFSLGISLALLITAACNAESKRSEPVSTTTDKGTSTAPPAKEAAERDKALVRIVHAVPGGQALDAFVGDTKEFTNITYNTVTPYKEVPSLRHVHKQFALRPAGQDAAPPLAKDTEGIGSGSHYTVIALPTVDGRTTLRVLADKLTPPPAGKASVRIVNASLDAGEVNVFVKGQEKELFHGVNFQTATSYNDLNPQTVTLEVRPEGKKDVLLTVPNVAFEGAHRYTIILLGKAKGTPRLEAIKVDDLLIAATPSP